MILAIDPGNESTAWVTYDGVRPVEFAREPNETLRKRFLAGLFTGENIDAVAIEMIASYGMAVGREVFDTCVWIGRFVELAHAPVTLVYRADVKLHLCRSMRAKDGNVRQAIVDRFGPDKATAIGKKRSPGPLYGVSGDVWSAVGVAITWWETRRETRS